MTPRGFQAEPEDEFFFACSHSFPAKLIAVFPLMLPSLLGAPELLPHPGYIFTVLSTLFAQVLIFEPDVVIESESVASSQRVIPRNSVDTVELLRMCGEWLIVPVPKLVNLAFKVPELPVALVKTPLAAIGRLEELVVKFWDDDAQTPLGSAEFAARAR